MDSISYFGWELGSEIEIPHTDEEELNFINISCILIERKRFMQKLLSISLKTLNTRHWLKQL